MLVWQDLLARVPHYVPIAAGMEWNFDDLLEKVWQYLAMLRIYTKPRGQIPDYDAPVVVPSEKNTVEEVQQPSRFKLFLYMSGQSYSDSSRG